MQIRLTLEMIQAIARKLREHDRPIIHGHYWLFAPAAERYLHSLWSLN